MGPIKFDYKVNGRMVTVCADNFTEDPSVGLYLGPEELWIEDPETGKEEPIPEALEYELSRIATDIYLDSAEEDGLCFYDEI